MVFIDWKRQYNEEVHPNENSYRIFIDIDKLTSIYMKMQMNQPRQLLYSNSNQECMLLTKKIGS